jgi:hypothetical protein
MSISDAPKYEAFQHFGRMAALVAEEDRPTRPESGRIIGYIGRAPSPKPTPKPFPTLVMALRTFFKSALKPMKSHSHAA